MAKRVLASPADTAARYDVQFHDAIAYDERLTKIASAMAAEFQTYLEAEAFFSELARASGREPWEVDRLLYHFNSDALDTIASLATVE